MTLLIQDGRRGGHLKWALDALTAGVAGGVILSPFHTPRTAVPHHYAGSRVVDDVLDLGGEALFDSCTHARLLPGTNDVVHYDSWQLWGPSGVGLDTPDRRYEHVERVFARQATLGVRSLAPTLTLDGPLGMQAQHALETARIARGLDAGCVQSMAGKRSFWRSGADLDAYVGQLATLRASTWILTVVNDVVGDNTPNMADHDAFVGLCRTVHSLSRRSRVILAHSDYVGLPAVAAGADSVGTGWDRGMRYFDPHTFQLSTPGIRVPASYVTQGGLVAVLRRDTADAITRVGAPLADRARGGPMPADDAAERTHHLAQLGRTVDAVNAHGANRSSRVDQLRHIYSAANTDFNDLLGRLPRRIIAPEQRVRWVDNPTTVLNAYAAAERL